MHPQVVKNIPTTLLFTFLLYLLKDITLVEGGSIWKDPVQCTLFN